MKFWQRSRSRKMRVCYEKARLGPRGMTHCDGNVENKTAANSICDAHCQLLLAPAKRKSRHFKNNIDMMVDLKKGSSSVQFRSFAGARLFPLTCSSAGRR